VRGARRRRGPSLGEALALGALQGPTELMPVSSSGHTALLPWLAGWRYGELDAGERKAFEVALHAGAGLALALAMRGELIESARALDRRHAAVVALSLAPPVLAGYALEGPIERRLGGPRSIVLGLLGGAAALALGDRRPRERREHEATPADGLALGLAQAAALMPGVSRNGATLAVARARRFAREDAQTLSWHAALPVILGAVTLKAWRLTRGGVARESWPALAVGGGAAFVSTVAAANLLRAGRRGGRALWPYAAYRCTIAAIALRRWRRSQNTKG
jgi:undecaprenyl-diphosphatase